MSALVAGAWNNSIIFDRNTAKPPPNFSPIVAEYAPEHSATAFPNSFLISLLIVAKNKPFGDSNLHSNVSSIIVTVAGVLDTPLN